MTSQQIKDILRARKTKQRQVAAALGCSDTTVSVMVRRKAKMGDGLEAAFAKFLGVKLEDFRSLADAGLPQKEGGSIDS
ncbi:MAG: XRE family transcriptional regulator [Gammaproteobacteria bacterium]|nr:XRE family transcriptional regulator [Gammaproteobacteria bacterium]